MHGYGFSDSLVLFNLVSIEVDVLIFHLSFGICKTTNKIVYSMVFIPLKSLLLLSGSHVSSWKTKNDTRVEARYSALAEIPFQLHEIFSDFQSGLNCAHS